jgi:hypothetical protein
LVLPNSINPFPGSGRVAPQSFELLHGPANEVFVDAHREGVQLGAVEGPVEVDPAADLGVENPGEVLNDTTPDDVAVVERRWSR